jgi:hypothetical protein
MANLGGLEDELWEVIVEVRDNYPRVKNDAPTDEIVEEIMTVLRSRGLV